MINDITNTINGWSDFLAGVQTYKLRDASEPPKKGTIQKQGIPFMLEVQMANNAEAEYFIFPAGVENVEYSWQSRTNVTHTQAGAFADAIGIIPPKIVLQGTFGYYYTATNDGMDGAAKQLEFVNLVEGFFTRFAKYTTSGKELSDARWTKVSPGKYSDKKIAAADMTNAPKVTFYDFTASEYWQVNIDQFKLMRNKERKLLYMYSIAMSGLKRAGDDTDAKIIKAKAAAIAAKKNTTTSTWLDSLRSITSCIDDVQKFLIATNRLTATIKGIIDKAINIVKQVTNIITTAIAQGKALLAMPAAIALEFRNAIKGLMDAVASVDGMPASNIIATRQAMRTAFTLEKTSTANKDQQTPDNDTSAEEKIFGNSQTSQTVSVAKQSISSNDTVHTIAQKNGVDWKQMVALNKLDAPYISDKFMDKFTPAVATGHLGANAEAGAIDVVIYGVTPAAGNIVVIGQTEAAVVSSVEGNKVRLQSALENAWPAGAEASLHATQLAVLAPGEMISIPGTGQGGVSAIGDDFEEKLYWIDEAMDSDGYMVGTGELAVKKGISNLEMQLRHLLKTGRGELTELGHPEYGSRLPEFIGKTSTEVWQMRAKLECENTIRQDPRIAEVSNATLTVDGTAIIFEGDAYPINQAEPMAISLPLS